MSNADPVTNDLAHLSVSALVSAICRRVGLEPNDVGRLEITPFKLTATVYKRNPEGKKWVADDGKPATETWEVNLRP